MINAKEYALETAKEITIAALQGCHDQVNADLSAYAAKYFETVYNKIYKLAQDNEDD